ncbi:voltage-gated potassium channel [Aureococcus anophagefferens]|nr:voltage-gated potassium channel [Aureococcus anophagefferens]
MAPPRDGEDLKHVSDALVSLDGLRSQIELVGKLATHQCEVVAAAAGACGDTDAQRRASDELRKLHESFEGASRACEASVNAAAMRLAAKVPVKYTRCRSTSQSSENGIAEHTDVSDDGGLFATYSPYKASTPRETELVASNFDYKSAEADEDGDEPPRPFGAATTDALAPVGPPPRNGRRRSSIGQLMSAVGADNVLGLGNADSEEVSPEDEDPVARRKRMETSRLSVIFEQHDKEAIEQSLKESERDPWHKRCCGMINPSGVFRIMWDVFIAFFIFYVLVTEPLSMGFWDDDMLKDGTALGRMNRVMDVVFIVDLVLNFRTGYFTSDGILVMSPGAAARHYLLTWFTLDFVSSMPPVLEVLLALIGAAAGGADKLSSAKVFKLIKVMKVFKALRIGKFLKLLSNEDTELMTAVEEFMSSSFGALAAKVMSIIMSSFLIAHLLACFMAVSGDGWLRTYSPRHGDDDPASEWSWRRQYLAAIYWAFTTMTTVGFGDITPAGDMERIFAIFGMLMGVSFYSYIIASVSSMVSSVDSKNAVYFEKMDQLASWMEHYNIEPALKRRVRRFFKQFYTDHSAIEDEYIMEKLSPSLQEAISIYLLHDFVLEHSLFTDLPEGSLWKAGDANVSLFIFKGGTCYRDFEDEQKTPNEKLEEGCSFGELCLLGCSNESDITVVAETKSDFFYIRRDAFLDAFSNLPEVFAKMFEKRALFVDKDIHPRGGRELNRKHRYSALCRIQIFNSTSM